MQCTNKLGIALGLAVVFVLSAKPALCQRPGGAGGGVVGGGMPTTQPGTNPPRTQEMNDQSRGLFLSGKVQLDDGTAPPQPVVIERVCNGAPHAEAYTDSKGRFNFQIGQNRGIIQDASDGSVMDTGVAGLGTGANANTTLESGASSRNKSVGPADLSGCELRAALPGYRSDVVSLSGRRIFDRPDIGVIILHRRANVEGTTISATTLQAPKDARKAYDKAQEDLHKGKFAEAQKNLEKAVNVFPQFAAAWYDLGRMHEKQNELEEARRCYSKAADADPKFVNPHLPLALLFARDKNWQRVADETSRLTTLDPVDFPQAFFYNAVANFNLRKFDVAEVSVREALKLDTAHQMPKANQVLSAILAEKQDYAGAAEQIRTYLMLVPNCPEGPALRQQLTELDKLAAAPKAKTETQQR